MPDTIELLKVAATSKPQVVAGAIASILRNKRKAEIHAIGAGAVNQAIKSCAIARGYVAAGGIELLVVPSFVDLDFQGVERTGIRLLVTGR